MPYFSVGESDAARGLFYGSSLPYGTSANSEIRATYRAGWITSKAKQGKENLPAYFMQLGTNYYWIVAIDGGKPVYNVTRGETPDNQAGYFNLAALIQLRGDSFNG